MSIEAIKERLQRFKEGKPNWVEADKDFVRNAPDDISFLLEQNQRLVEALEIAEKEGRKLSDKNMELLLALIDINVCCPDPETLEYDTEGGKEDYADALIHVRSFL